MKFPDLKCKSFTDSDGWGAMYSAVVDPLSYCQDTTANNSNELRTTFKESRVCLTPQQSHRWVFSMLCCMDAVIRAKGVQTKYWVCLLWVYRDTPQKVDISVWSILFYLFYLMFTMKLNQHFKKSLIVQSINIIWISEINDLLSNIIMYLHVAKFYDCLPL